MLQSSQLLLHFLQNVAKNNALLMDPSLQLQQAKLMFNYNLDKNPYETVQLAQITPTHTLKLCPHLALIPSHANVLLIFIPHSECSKDPHLEYSDTYQ